MVDEAIHVTCGVCLIELARERERYACAIPS